MENNKNTIPLYPYNGRSLNLIDKFYIFGYNYLTLKKYILEGNPGVSPNNLNESGLGYFQIKEKPFTLSEITYDFNKQIVEPEIIKKRIFPNSLFVCYRIEVDNINIISNRKSNDNWNELEASNFTKVDLSEDKSGCPKSYRSVFSCLPLEGKNSRKCQNGFAYTFYRKFWKKKEINGIKYIFYIPYTFCIISEYPYYKNFEKLFRCIRKMFAQPNIYIPIEILLYKIIALTPSPINTDVILDLDLMCNQEKLFIDEPPKNNENIVVPNIEQNNNNFIIISNYTMSSIISNNPFETQLKFNYLSGYPLIQYNLAKVLFHTLSIEDIINIFIFSFLESDIIFFSKDNEYLTLTINAYANFNYPLNDAEYFYNIGAISLESFQGGDDIFGIKNTSSIIAINNEYVENYLTNCNKMDEHLIVDLDSGELSCREKLEEEGASFGKIIDLIKNICQENPNYSFMKDKILYKAINKLYKRLKEIHNKNEVYFYKEFIDFNEKNDDDDKSGISSIDELNKSIQEAFYECLIFLSLYYYENIIIEQHQNEFRIDFYREYQEVGNYTREEILILNQMKDSMKFSGSFSQFVLEHNPIDLYKIPLTFMDEFLSVFSQRKFDLKNTNIKYFELIDKLYLSKKLEESKKLDFRSDMNKYIGNFKDIIDREIQDNYKNKYNFNFSTLIKICNNQNKNVIKYQSYELDENILIKYNYMINNLSEGQYYSLVSDEFSKEENLIKEIDVTEIETKVEKFLIENENITTNDICSANIILLFAISFKYFPEDCECDLYLSTLFQIFNPYRKHVAPLLRIIYKLYERALDENNNNIRERMKICFYKSFNYIMQNRIVPNENLMIIINKITKLLLEENNIINRNRNRNSIEESREIPVDNNIINNALDFSITEENLHIHYNFTSVRFYSENYVVNLVNKEHKGYFNLPSGGIFEIFSPKIRFAESENDTIESVFICQRDLYEIITTDYNKYIENLDFNVINKDDIFDACLNNFIYLRNNRQLRRYDDIMQIMEIVFYIFKISIR